MTQTRCEARDGRWRCLLVAGHASYHVRVGGETAWYRWYDAQHAPVGRMPAELSKPSPCPGDPIAKVGCPCCGADLRIEHGDEPGEVCVVGVAQRGTKLPRSTTGLLGGGAE